MIIFPNVLRGLTYTSSSGLLTLDASGEKAGMQFMVPKTGSITKIGFGTRTVTTGNALKARLETVSSGLPSGTAYGGCDYGSVSVGDTDDNKNLTVTFGTAASAVKGDIAWAVVEFDTYVAGNLVIASYPTVSTTGFEGTALYTGSWTSFKSNKAVGWCEYSDGSIYPFAWNDGTPSVAADYVGGGNLSSSTTPDEKGNLIGIPFLCNVVGVMAHLDMDGACDAVLYSLGGAVLQSKPFFSGTTRSMTSGYSCIAMFDLPVRMEAGTLVRAVVKPTTTTISQLTQSSSSSESVSKAAGMYSQYKQPFYMTYRTDAGEWTDDKTAHCQVALLLDLMVPLSLNRRQFFNQR